jgi:hypothetical protein
VASLLPDGTYTADLHGFPVWIMLPEGWTRATFASQGQSAGLGVIGSDPFCVAGTPPETVRLSLRGPSTRQQTTQGLKVHAHAFEGSPTLASTDTGDSRGAVYCLVFGWYPRQNEAHRSPSGR